MQFTIFLMVKKIQQVKSDDVHLLVKTLHIPLGKKVLSMSSKAFYKLSSAVSEPVSWVLSLPPPPIGSTLVSSLLLK